MQKICHISTAHQTFDTRIYYKECRTLAKNNYDVNLIISGEKDQISENIKIIHLPTKNSRLYRFLNKNKIAFKKAIKIDADIYHIHDPELIFIGNKLKKKNKKIIYDVHEDVPKQILTKEWLKNDFIRFIVSKSFNKLEKRISNKFDKIVCASEEISKKFNSNKTAVVRNYSIIYDIDYVDPIKIQKNKPIVIYAGSLTKIRGIREIIEAIGILDDKVELWLLGKWDNEKYRTECMNLPGWKYVKEFGMVPQSKVYSYMKKADIGIINFWPVDNHIKSIPNKPFEYMACGLPMIMSNFKYWKKIFKGCFLPVNSKNPSDIAKAIMELLENEDLMHEFSSNGRRKVEEKYSWEKESENLLNVYRSLKN